jgi:hypothetical protein
MPLLALIFLLAQEALPKVPPPMEADDSPTAFACTFAAAIRGDQCTFEGAKGPADARDNSAAAARAGQQACGASAKGNEGLRKDCERAVAEASLGIQCALNTRLSDGQGRLTIDSADCVESLRAAVARTGRSVSLSLDCCSCLSDAKCGVSENQCHRELADLSPSEPLRACMSRSCESACRSNRPPRAAPMQQQELVPAPPAPSHPATPRDSNYKT